MVHLIDDIDPTTDPVPTLGFDALGLSDDVLEAIRDLGWERPSPVQGIAVPLARQGIDVVVQAQTGTGKTGAFGIPLIEGVGAHGSDEEAVGRALVMCPTRELARQVAAELDLLGARRGASCAVVYGGVGYEKQVQDLRSKPFVVGTPGRILDLARRRKLDLGRIRHFILDECDEMLSMGFMEDILEVIKRLPDKRDRQTMLFSATVTPEIRHLAGSLLNEPEFVDVSSDQVAAESVHHTYYPVSAMGRLGDLARVLAKEAPESGIIFCNTRAHVAMVAGFLGKMGFDAAPISGDLPQKERERIMARMKANDLRFLVATDVASRGIDISQLDHVFNYELPQSAEVYIHRTGRTGRAGRQGTAISLIGPQDTGVFYHLKLIYKFDMEERALAEIDKKELEKQRLAEAYARELEREAKLADLPAAGGGGGGRDRDRDRDRGRGRDRDRGRDRGRDRDRDRDRGRGSDEGRDEGSEHARVYVSAGLNAFLDGEDEARATMAELSGVDASAILKVDLHPQYAFLDVEPAHADALIEGLNGAEVRGKSLKSERARSKPRNRRRGR